jgi:CheY-like chemotaxis protein
MNPSHYRILVADDNSDTADSTAELLRLEGHEVRSVYDGQQAVEAARTFRPHLVILDINMPVMDGYDAATTLRKELANAQLVLIAFTSLAQPADVDRVRRAGFDHYLGKPAANGELAALVAKFLGVGQGSSQLSAVHRARATEE